MAIKIFLYFFIFLGAATVAGLTAGCLDTTPRGQGSTDESGTPRDPSEILPVGVAAPAFTGTTDEGNLVSLADFAGRQNVVLVFYPANETPGCTRQLCAARDAWDAYVERNIQVFGVNPGSIESHQAFRANHNFPFPLISDSEGEIIRAYGARGAMGVTTRTVYGINAEGRIVFAERGIPETDAILAAFESTGE